MGSQNKLPLLLKLEHLVAAEAPVEVEGEHFVVVVVVEVLVEGEHFVVVVVVVEVLVEVEHLVVAGPQA